MGSAIWILSPLPLFLANGGFARLIFQEIRYRPNLTQKGYFGARRARPFFTQKDFNGQFLLNAT